MDNDDIRHQEGAALKALLDGRPGTKKAFAINNAVPGGPSMLSQHISGHRPINLDAAYAYATGLGVPVSAFSPRLAKMINRLTGATEPPKAGECEIEYQDELRVPLLANSASMGPGADDLQGDVVIGSLALSAPWVERFVRPHSSSALRFIHAYGDSMTPTINDGDILLVDTSVRDASRIDGIYVLRGDDRLYVKRVRSRYGGPLEVSSDNPVIKTVDVLNGDTPLDVLGRVVWIWNGHGPSR